MDLENNSDSFFPSPPAQILVDYKSSSKSWEDPKQIRKYKRRNLNLMPYMILF